MSAANKKIVLEYLETLHNKRDPDSASKFAAENYTHHIPHYDTTGFGSIRAGFDNSEDGMQDRRLTIEHQIAEGDFVVTWGKFEGTHTGVYHGFPPTGRIISFSAMFIHRLENGLLTEHWNGSDRLHQMQQLSASDE